MLMSFRQQIRLWRRQPPVFSGEIFTAVFGAAALLAGFSSQADGQRDSPVNGSQQRLCKLLTPNEKGQRVAKRVGQAPTLTLRVMCRTKTSICTAEREEFPGIPTDRDEQECFHLNSSAPGGRSTLLLVKEA